MLIRKIEVYTHIVLDKRKCCLILQRKIYPHWDFKIKIDTILDCYKIHFT